MQKILQKKIANLQKNFTLFFFIWGPLHLGKIPTFKDGIPSINSKIFLFFDKKFFAINSPKILLFVSHYHLLPIEAKQFFRSILVFFKIKLRKLCYTGCEFLDTYWNFFIKSFICCCSLWNKHYKCMIATTGKPSCDYQDHHFFFKLCKF